MGVFLDKKNWTSQKLPIFKIEVEKIKFIKTHNICITW